MSDLDARRAVLRYDAGLSGHDTWRLLDSGRGVAVRVKIERVECASEVELRWKARDAKDWPDAFFCSPVDAEGTLWLTEPVVLGGGLLRRELQLERCPDHASALMLGW